VKDVFVFDGKQNIKAFSMGDVLILSELSANENGKTKIKNGTDIFKDGFSVPPEVTNSEQDFVAAKMEFVHIEGGQFVLLNDDELAEALELFEENKGYFETLFQSKLAAQLHPSKKECGCKGGNHAGKHENKFAWVEGYFWGATFAFTLIWLLVVFGKRK
jgi:hypothetical protein